MSSLSYAETVSNGIIKQLKEGTAPWIKPWEPGESFKPYNAATGNEYKGLNALWLMSVAEAKGYTDNRWMTFKQSNSQDAQVSKGEKSTTIQYWKWTQEQTKLSDDGKPLRDEEGNLLKIAVPLEQPKVFYAKVFNAEQISGLEPALPKRLLSEPERHEQAEKLLTDSGANILYRSGNRAFYQPSTDRITMPERAQFKSPDAFYATAYHEVGHWTGHESRLNRDLAHPFGSEGYAKEELRAEIASLMVGDQLQIGHDPGQHVAYINSWIKAIENDHREIFRAASDAEKIQGYVLGLGQQQDAVQEALQEQEPETVISIQMPTIQAERESEMNTSNERVYLAVPYVEKEEAKALGARWDKAEQSWFAPPGTDLTPLEPWIPKPSEHVSITAGPEPREAFAAALAESGLMLGGLPTMDGQIHRVKVQGDGQGERSGSYVGHMNGRPAGYIQNFKTGEKRNWKLGVTVALSAVERARMAAEAAQKRQDRANAIEHTHLETAKVVEAHWQGGTPADNHPYLEAKGVSAHGLKVDTIGTIRLPQDDPEGQRFSAPGNLLVPVQDIDGKLWGVQSIDEHGRKSLPRGCKKQGGHHVMGELDKHDQVLFAEGYATAATLHEVTGLPVVMTFDSGNMKPVAEAYREKYPSKTLILAGDDDRFNAMGINVGREKAQEAAESVGGYTLLPPFQKNDSGSDWNDFQKLYGVSETQRNLQSALRVIDVKQKAQVRMAEKADQLRKEQLPERESVKEMAVSLSR
jgi:putative DNA primase/helicase